MTYIKWMLVNVIITWSYNFVDLLGMRKIISFVELSLFELDLGCMIDI